MKEKKEIIIKSILIAISACSSAFFAGLITNRILRESDTLLFIILFILFMIILFESTFFVSSILIGKMNYFYSLNNRLIKGFRNSEEDKVMDQKNIDRLKDIIHVNKEDRSSE